MFNKQELQMLLILLNRVNITGNEAENLVVLKGKITEELQKPTTEVMNDVG